MQLSKIEGETQVHLPQITLKPKKNTSNIKYSNTTWWGSTKDNQSLDVVHGQTMTKENNLQHSSFNNEVIQSRVPS